MLILELSEPSSPLLVSDAPAVDIVAVHGLYENALDTWTDPETNILWLRDLYPHKHHRARMLIYSYKAETLASPGEGFADRILPCATSSVAELFAHHLIIFVCHGLGGLLVKRALASSSTRRAKSAEHLRSIYISIYAITFMGRAHKGISKDSLLLLRQDDGPGPSQFMISLLKESEMVNEITDPFAPLIKQFSIYNFWEQVETRSGNVKAYVVEEDSAAPAWDNVERCRIMATRSGMVKMRSSVDHGYRVVLKALERYTRVAPGLVKSRWQKYVDHLATERKEEADLLLNRSSNIYHPTVHSQ